MGNPAFISRRDFLKFSGAVVGGLVYPRVSRFLNQDDDDFHKNETRLQKGDLPINFGMVGREGINGAGVVFKKNGEQDLITLVQGQIGRIQQDGVAQTVMEAPYEITSSAGLNGSLITELVRTPHGKDREEVTMRFGGAKIDPRLFTETSMDDPEYPESLARAKELMLEQTGKVNLSGEGEIHITGDGQGNPLAAWVRFRVNSNEVDSKGQPLTRKARTVLNSQLAIYALAPALLSMKPEVAQIMRNQAGNEMVLPLTPVASWPQAKETVQPEENLPPIIADYVKANPEAKYKKLADGTTHLWLDQPMPENMNTDEELKAEIKNICGGDCIGKGSDFFDVRGVTGENLEIIIDEDGGVRLIVDTITLNGGLNQFKAEIILDKRNPANDFLWKDLKLTEPLTIQALMERFGAGKPFAFVFTDNVTKYIGLRFDVAYPEVNAFTVAHQKEIKAWLKGELKDENFKMFVTGVMWGFY